MRSCRGTTPVRPAAHAIVDAEPHVLEAGGDLRPRDRGVDHRDPAGRQRSGGQVARQPETHDAVALGQRERPGRAQVRRRPRVGPRALAGDGRRERRRARPPTGSPDRAAVSRCSGSSGSPRDERVQQRAQPALLLGDVVLALLEVRGGHDARRLVEVGHHQLGGVRQRVALGVRRRRPRARARPRCRRSGRRAADPRAACPRSRGPSPRRGTGRSARGPAAPPPATQSRHRSRFSRMTGRIWPRTTESGSRPYPGISRRKVASIVSASSSRSIRPTSAFEFRARARHGRHCDASQRLWHAPWRERAAAAAHWRRSNATSRPPARTPPHPRSPMSHRLPAALAGAAALLLAAAAPSVASPAAAPAAKPASPPPPRQAAGRPLAVPRRHVDRRHLARQADAPRRLQLELHRHRRRARPAPGARVLRRPRQQGRDLRLGRLPGLVRRVPVAERRRRRR